MREAKEKREGKEGSEGKEDVLFPKNYYFGKMIDLSYLSRRDIDALDYIFNEWKKHRHLIQASFECFPFYLNVYRHPSNVSLNWSERLREYYGLYDHKLDLKKFPDLGVGIVQDQELLLWRFVLSVRVIFFGFFFCKKQRSCICPMERRPNRD